MGSTIGGATNSTRITGGTTTTGTTGTQDPPQTTGTGETPQTTGQAPVQDGYQSALVPTSIKPKLTDPAGMSPKGQQVLKDFTAQLETKLQVNARDLFDPNLKTVEGHPLTKKLSSEDMTGMVLGTAKKMPLGDLPGGDLVAKGLKGIPGADLIKGDISQMSFNELSKALPDAGKKVLEDKFKPMFDNFRQNHKAAFYSMATAGAVGAGALAYTQGTEFLEKVGVKPEFSAKFLDSRLKVGVGGSWGPKFKDAQGELSLQTRTRDGNFSLGATVAGGVNGMQKVTVNGSANLSSYHPMGLDQLQLRGSYTHDFTQGMDMTSLGISGSKGSFNFSVTDQRNWTTGQSRTEADIGTKLWGGTLSGYAAHINDGARRDTQVGMVYRINF
jgi:hypothetical protein